MKSFFLVLMVLVAGCAGSRQGADDSPPAMRALGEAVTTTESPSDESIGAEIRRQMEVADAAGTASVVIEVSDGVVTLSGTANGLTGAWRAEAVAHSVPGVTEVRNEILINQAGGM